MNSTARAVRQGKVFASLSDEMLEEIASIARPKAFAARETIFSDGDTCLGFYLLTDGAVKLYKLSADGKEHILHMVWPGETFAEAALFLDDTYPAYAEAIRPSRALLFPREPFLELLKARPAFGLRLLGGMAIWLRRLVLQVEVLALRDAASRLSRYLRDMSQGGKAVLRYPKAMVASHLGMSPETLSRLFFKMEARGLIQVRGRTILLTDATALDAIAAGHEQL